MDEHPDGSMTPTGRARFAPLQEGRPILGDVVELKHRTGSLYDVETVLEVDAPKSSSTTVGWSSTLDDKWAKAFGRPSADMVN